MKYAILSARAPHSSSSVLISLPTTPESCFTQSANHESSTFIALSGLNAGRTLTFNVGSAFIFLCHSRESTGSSVVHTVFTLNLYIISLAVSVSNTLLALSHIFFAFAAFIMSSMPKYLCISRCDQ